MVRITADTWRGKGKRGLFNLRWGQYRLDNCLISRGHCYNRTGELVFIGNFDERDLWNVTDGLEKNELLIILHEDDVWGGCPNIPGNRAESPDNPGLAYLMEHAEYILTRGHFYRQLRSGRRSLHITGERWHDVPFRELDPVAVRKLVLSFRPDTVYDRKNRRVIRPRQ